MRRALLVLLALLTLTARAAPLSKESNDLQAVLYSLRAVYGMAVEIEEYRAIHGRLPEAKSAEELIRVAHGPYGSAKFGTSDLWSTPLVVESDPAHNTYTVAAAGSDKAFDRSTWSTPAQTRTTADDVV